jgi:phospholipase D1/2
MQSEPRPPSRIPKGLVLRFLVLVAIIAGGFALLRWSPWAHYFSREEIPLVLARLRGTWWAPLLLLAAYAVLSPLGVPASPLMIAGGAVFGTVMGSVYNLVGLVIGGASTYGLGRVLGRDLIVHLAGRQVKRVERAISRHGGFFGLAGVRFLPIPYALVNYCAAFAGVPFGLFIGSTAFGLCITVPIYTYFADVLANAASGHRTGIIVKFVLAVILLLVLTWSPRIWQARQRRARYLRLRADRARRRPPAGR